VVAGTTTLRLALPARTVPKGSRLAVVATTGADTARATVAVT
jgi:hypothetical protein